ncbi:thiol reductant ABC exporter subunit CydD [Epidermidibacterium keratini]|uniref:Thiol reductant ABC exporter subunit CydD n=1 Tax=Epidermidibacterium keratini TaxID=1891644 RepID=A0A7L4YQP8_9ACTN|nr:thiol reductant ABC exporter subunit CydD [Epidermidibacterium keratini]QHC01388.1 thiol reductant ABC exporter subunit CydD [Epidermidibacterium keratini]
MRPLDSRLLTLASATRWLMAGAVVVGVGATAAAIGYATVLASIITDAIRYDQPVAGLARSLAWLGIWILLRTAFAWAGEYFPRTIAARMTAQLRQALLRHVTTEDRGAGVRRSPSSLIALATSGIDDLQGYAARFLPQLVVATLVPIGVVAYVGWLDLTSALIVAGTLPLIPLFMVLIGKFTQTRTDRQYRRLEQLAHRFTDVVTGLSTLKAYGRAEAQGSLIADADARYKKAAMSTLRIAFLSSFALELLATLSVALVAVAIGLRLAGGSMELQPALTVLLVVPEAYLALRAVGTHFHDSVDGLTAAQRLFAVIEDRPAPSGTGRVPAGPVPIELRDIEVDFAVDDRRPVAIADLTIVPGTMTALRGPSGAGKSTVLNLVAGLLAPTSGAVVVGGTDLREIDRDAWRSHIAYAAQHPHLIAGTLGDNLRLLRPDAPDDELQRAVHIAALDDVVAGRGVDAELADGGAGLSHGQRQRVALARALVARRPLLLLDEPTSGLDEQTERLVLSRLRAALPDTTVIMASHSPDVLDFADVVLSVGAGLRS